jgi:hypothetical protein
LQEYETATKLIATFSGSRDNSTQQYIRSILESSRPTSEEAVVIAEKCTEYSEKGNLVAWSTVTELLSGGPWTIELQKVMSTALKSSVVKCGVVLRQYDDLLAVARHLFFTQPLPSAFSLENTMRISVEKDPAFCFELLQPYVASLSEKTHSLYIPSSNCFSYAIKASSINIAQEALNDVQLDDRQDLISLLDTAFRCKQLSVGLVSTALTSCRSSGSWRGSTEVLNFVKQRIPPVKSAAPPGKHLNYFEDGRIPSIIYGQVLANLAHCGAEISVYQLMCEMLENEASFTDTTIDYVFFETAKIGSYIMLIKLRDLLHRHGVKLSNKANNAILNACDKAGAYGAALSYYFFKMPHPALDYLGLSVLLKACDRSGSAKVATIIIMQAMQLKGIRMKSEIYQRLFAIYMKTKNVMLATAFLVYLEEIKVGALSFIGTRVKSNDLTTIVNEWIQDILSNGQLNFEEMYVETIKKYTFQPGADDKTTETWNIVPMSDLGITSSYFIALFYVN